MEFKNERLGQMNPYIYKDNLYYSFDQIKLNKTSLRIDIASIYSILVNGYICGDESLIEGIKRIPWYTNISNSNYEYKQINKYNELDMQEEQIAEEFYNLLYEEILNQVIGKNYIYIFLSGGMDSRVVAAVLNNISKDNNIGKVIAFSWGKDESRDPQIAKEICDLYGWDFIKLNLTSNDLISNISNSANLLGAEVSPIHLHKFRDIKDMIHEDSIILAGSYGDSIGRGEYSSVHVSKLNSHSYKVAEFNILKPDVHEKAKARYLDRIDNYHINNSKYSKSLIVEMEYHAFYMRRLLNNAMNINGLDVNIYQVFTSERVFNFIWSLKYSRRNDKIYYYLLKRFAPEVLNLPWARTGKTYYTNRETKLNTVSLTSKSHEYGLWLKQERSYVKNLIFDGTLENLNIFDMKYMKRLYYLWVFENEKYNSPLINLFSWLCSLSLFIKEYEINNTDLDSFPDKIIFKKNTQKEISKQILRNIKKMMR